MKRQEIFGTGTVGDPLHFDDAGAVKLMDVEANKVYPETDSYRRTVVMVQVSDEISYGVDFFRVIGGDDHLYSFHSQSDQIAETTGLELVKQADAQGNYIGTYAGADVPYGQDPNTVTTSYNYETLYPRGFTWLDQVNRAQNPENTFAVDFQVKDFHKVAGKVPDDLHLRLTMINNAQNPVSEVAIANGYPPNKAENSAIPNLKYMLVRRTGKSLDSLFTTVLEPYQSERYLKFMENVTVTDKNSGAEMQTNDVRAVKVTHHSGRVDYIVYARDNSVLYRIDDTFDFRGFVGVYSVGEDGQPLYRYLNDGDVLGEANGAPSAITGIVQDFTKELSMENFIQVSVEQDIDPAAFVGRMIRIDTDGVENGCYLIQGAEKQEDGSYRLDIGTISPIRSYKSASDLSKGFVYNITQGAGFRIPLSYLQDESPVFESVEERRVAAGNPMQATVFAQSPLDLELSYSATMLPRGAQFDPVTRTLHWTPGSNQLGRHHVAIQASDGLRSAVCHFYISVYNASSRPANSIVSPPDPKEDEKKSPIVEPPVEEERFIDLAGYGWAKESIYALAGQGVIQGTGENTYSPGKNITRADFAILLVRAFKLSGQGEESFMDVAPGAYYAREVSTAYANRIINGIGGGRFAPEQPITRQDAMLILYRALQKTGAELEDADQEALKQFSDEAQISDYARGAAAALASKGFVQGDNGAFHPQAHITRAETAVLLHRVVETSDQG